MKKVIIKSGLTSHQRFMLIILFLAFFSMGTYGIVEFALSPTLKFRTGDYIALLLFLLSFGILALLISKEGIVIENGKLFNSQFIFGKPCFKSGINLHGMTDICILSYNLSQKLIFISAANPDLADEIRVSKIFLLNENHSQMRLVLSTTELELAKLIASEIQQEFGFNFTKYNPPAHARRR